MANKSTTSARNSFRSAFRSGQTLNASNLPAWLSEILPLIQAELQSHSAENSPSAAFQPRTPQELAAYIDHTLLKADATSKDIQKVCEEARQHGFATVCVNGSRVQQAATLLDGSNTQAIAVVGFPLGAMTSEAKAFETRQAIQAGAREIDMVIPIGALKGEDHFQVLSDIRQVVEAAGSIPVKVILETSSLTQDEKIIGCALSKVAGAAFVKTSTGFGSGGATIEDVALMRLIVGPEMGVKASGGIRTYDDAVRMIRAGANRVGASASVAIVGGVNAASSESAAKSGLY